MVTHAHKNRRQALASAALLLLAIAGAIGLSIFSEQRRQAAAVPKIVGAVRIDVNATGVALQAASDRFGTLHAWVFGAGGEQRYKAVEVDERDNRARVAFDALAPAREYRYRMWFESDQRGRLAHSTTLSGRFRTTRD